MASQRRSGQEPTGSTQPRVVQQQGAGTTSRKRGCDSFLADHTG